jgi:DNA excision repair protein ERCC-2
MTELIKEAAEYFPYREVRPFQDEFINTIYEAVANETSVLIEGSNGLGKTVAALSACLPHALEKNLKILYVARTHRQHDRVIEELDAIARKHEISGISIRGRQEMCLNHVVTRHASDARSVMEMCELLKARKRCQYHRNIEEKARDYAELQQYISVQPYKASEIQRICHKHGFCPYELVKDSLADMNVIALSYLYVFDPTIRNAFFRNLDVRPDKIILIIDEAHNLPETAVDIASSSLSLFTMRQAELEAQRLKHRDIAQFANVLRGEVEKKIRDIKKESLVSSEFLTQLTEEKEGVDEPQKFFKHVHDVGNAIKRELLFEGEYPRSYIHIMGEFLLRWLTAAEDKSFVEVLSKYISRRGTLTAKLEIVALDPSKITAPIFSTVRSSVIMSGTLQPLEAYVQITELPKNTIKKAVPSPFPNEHVLPLICYGVTTAMEKRTPQMYSKIVERIEEVVKNTPANVGIFAASFEVLGALLEAGLKKTLKKPLYCEHRSMSSRENEKLVAQFKTYSKQDGAVLLGVQGGRSSEGVDFPGDEMNSAVIVGIPYAEPTPRVKAQIEYFDQNFPGFGREYGYVLPAMKRACQAAGRPIRTLEDMGAMIFLDYRFATNYCQSFLPPWIRNNLKVVPDRKGAIATELAHFFKRAS